VVCGIAVHVMKLADLQISIDFGEPDICIGTCYKWCRIEMYDGHRQFVTLKKHHQQLAESYIQLRIAIPLDDGQFPQGLFAGGKYLIQDRVVNGC
jgi:hypothetical protein